MNSARVGFWYAAAASFAMGPLVVAFVRAEDGKGATASSQATTKPAGAEAVRLEEARIKRFIAQMVEFRELGAIESETTVKHFSGSRYVVRAVYARGHAWRLYLASPLPGNPNYYDVSAIGAAAGERGVERCVGVLLQEQGWPEAKIDFPGTVRKSLEALAADYGVIVNGKADIPGYAKAPLAADLSGVIRPMWSYVSKGPREEDVPHYVICTYQQIAGQVFRHEFVFGRGWSVTTLRLATGVGDARYLQ